MSNEASAVRPSTVQPSFVTDAAGSRADVDISPTSIGRYRWVICALLFFATTINYTGAGPLGPQRSLAGVIHALTDVAIECRPYGPRLITAKPRFLSTK